MVGVSAAGGPTREPFSASSASPRRGSRPASEAYRSQADRYDRRTDAFRHWREQLVEQLPVQRGATVLDVGCGTGLCMPLLQDKIGSTGTIVGVDASADMLDVAGERVAEHRWDNVRLITAPIESAPLPDIAHAALFCAVHDVMQSRVALDNVFRHLQCGAPVAATGGKWPAPWTWPLPAWVANLHAPFVSDFAGFDRPWRLLAEFAPDLRVRELGFGAGYIAVGHAAQSMTS